MGLFRFVLLTGLCAYSTSPFLSYAISPKHHHHHRYADRLKRNQHYRNNRNSIKPSQNIESPLQQKVNEKYPECKNIFSPIKNFLASQAWEKNLSLTKLKLAAQNATNSQIALDLTLLPQWTHPRINSGTTQPQKLPSWQLCFSPNISWELYNSPEAGTGTLDFNYTIVRYWNNSAANLNTAVGTSAGINDYTAKESYLGQLTFSQTFPGNVWTIVLGQYSLYAIDGTLYDNDQQTGFISYALSQNASATYSQGSLGAYLQFSPTAEIQIQVGAQDAFDLTGTSLNFNNLTKNKYNFFGFFSWSPSTWGGGQYSLLLYSTRSVPKQPSQTMGWSVNIGQNLGEKLYVFGRWNGATGTAFAINRSVAWGISSANPFNRDPKDLFGLGYAISKVNTKTLPPPSNTPVRKYETVAEVFATIGFGPHLSLTPDYQIFIHPALRPERSTSQVYGVRGNFIF